MSSGGEVDEAAEVEDEGVDSAETAISSAGGLQAKQQECRSTRLGPICAWSCSASVLESGALDEELVREDGVGWAEVDSSREPLTARPHLLLILRTTCWPNYKSCPARMSSRRKERKSRMSVGGHQPKTRRPQLSSICSLHRPPLSLFSLTLSSSDKQANRFLVSRENAVPVLLAAKALQAGVRQHVGPPTLFDPRDHLWRCGRQQTVRRRQAREHHS